MCQGHRLVVSPQRVSGNVGHHHRFAPVGRRATRANLRAYRCTFYRLGVRGWQAGGSQVVHVLPGVVQQQDRTHGVRQQLLVGRQQGCQQLLQVNAPGHAFEETAFDLFCTLLGVLLGHVGQHAMCAGDLPGCIALDAGVVFQPYPAAAGGSHAVALVVAVLADGKVIGNLLVNAGQIVGVNQ